MFYSFKTNSDKFLIRELLAQGCNFDCASMQEIKSALELGVLAENIIYANPCKNDEHLMYAKEKGVTKMTFDCVEEAQNIHKIFPHAEVILRIAVEETDAPSPMGKKFGAPE